MRYPDLPNPDLLSGIPLDAWRVLDVGCNTGALGAAYARLNPDAALYGVDTDPVALAIADGRGMRTACADIEAGNPFSGETYDCIVFGDVLEHLREPIAVLSQARTWLTEAGTILICVPNVEHWSFARRLLGGDWDYEPDGLFDRTHLRWFSRATMRRGLAAAGLIPCDVRPRVFGADHGRAFVDAARPTLAALGVDAEAYAERALPLQYVWRAQAAFRPRMGIAATMLRPVGGVSDVRVGYPIQALATDPALMTRVCVDLAEAPDWPDDLPKIMVLHRPVMQGPARLAELRALFARGWVVVTEFDDHPDYFPALSGRAQYGFGGVHAVQTSTEALAEVFRLRNGEVAVFPNAVRELPDPRNFARPDTTRPDTGHQDALTLFFGALNREADWQPFMPALNAAADAFGGRLRFSVVHDRAFFDALRTPHKRFTPTCDHATYLTLLGEAELAFLPLRDTPFNACKSDLKFIEAAACRVAALASPTVYAGSIQDGRTGVIVPTPEAFARALARLVADPDAARDMADAARAMVARTRMGGAQMAARRAWYWSLWERRAALSEAVYQRIPALRPGTPACGVAAP